MRRRFAPRAARVVLGALAPVVIGACGTGTPGGARSTSTTVHVALPAGRNPSVSAQMVCATRTQRELANVLGVAPVAPVVPTWVDHVYTCRYQYADGVMVLSVKELSDRTQTSAYFAQLGTSRGNTGTLSGLGQGAFSTTDGSAVVRKDYKVLLVDVSRLPTQFGVPPTSAADIAVTVSDLILGCWNGS